MEKGTIREIVSLSSQYLERHQIPSAKRRAEDMVASALGCKRLELFLDYDRPLIKKEIDQVRSYLKRRSTGEPLAYIEGAVSFFGSKIFVDKRVLIPRPETEILVEKVAHQIEASENQKLVLWDLCTGSGCIGISLKKRFPSIEATLSDISEEALELAAKNAEENNVELLLVSGDLLAPFEGKKADIIVCNPPYISEEEYLALDKGVLEFEPKQALLAGVSGLEFFERVAKSLSLFLNPGGKAYFETGHAQADSLLALFSIYGHTNCTYQNDWAGCNRFFLVESDG